MMRPFLFHRAHALAAILLLSCATFPVASHAQAQQSRSEDLAKVTEMLSDPDPSMRLANMEAIVKSGDALKTDLAIRTGFSSDDADLRALAFRAYLATHKELTFDVMLPPAVQKQNDEATASARRELHKEYPYLAALARVAFRVQLVVAEYTFPQNAGQLKGHVAAPFTIAGDKVTSLVPLRHLGKCYVDFRPGRKQNLEGTLACHDNWPRLAISAAAF